MDYEGDGKWTSGEWKCKKYYIKNIYEKCNKYIRETKANVHIQYVPAHFGIFGNETLR